MQCVEELVLLEMAQNLQKSTTGQKTLMIHYQFYITSLVPQLFTTKPEQPYSTRTF